MIIMMMSQYDELSNNFSHYTKSQGKYNTRTCIENLVFNGIHSLEARTKHVGESINISKYLKTVSITICVLLRLAC